MNFNTYDKAAIILTGILIFTAIICSANTYKKSNAINFSTIRVPVFDEKDLPSDMRKLSKELNAFQDLYGGDELVFTYGYEPLSVENDKNKKFHKNMSKAFNESNLNFKFVPYENYENALDKVQENNGKNPEACTRFAPGEKSLETMINTTSDCLRHACVIDVKNNKYYIMSRNIPFIIRHLKELNSVQKVK